MPNKQDLILSQLAAPARRALASLQIDSIDKLSTYTEKEISALHGIGPSVIKRLKFHMRSIGFNFKNE